MKLSKFGEKFSGDAGILSLMDDLGNAMAEGGMIMMGGGNPGSIPEIESVMREQMQRLVDDDQALRKLIGIYDPPQGKKDFLKALAALLRKEFGWDISSENICLTNGSQAAFFMLFNMFAGECEGGTKRKILLPMAPEYIGYADLGLSDDFFVSVRPRIECVGENLFKYRVDFDNISITEDIGAICISRPTNPTGNVLTDEEVNGLAELAKEHDIPLIVDSAYGVPFPCMIYTDVEPVWNENIIVNHPVLKGSGKSSSICADECTFAVETPFKKTAFIHRTIWQNQLSLPPEITMLEFTHIFTAIITGVLSPSISAVPFQANSKAGTSHAYQ